MAGIKISQLNEKKIKNNEDMFEVSYNDEENGLLSRRMKRRNVLNVDWNYTSPLETFKGRKDHPSFKEHGSIEFPYIQECQQESFYYYLYDLSDIDESLDVIVIHSTDFNDTHNDGVNDKSLYYMLNLPSPEKYDVGEEIKIILSNDQPNSNKLLIVCNALILYPDNPIWDREGRDRGSDEVTYDQTNISFGDSEQTIKRFITPGFESCVYTGSNNYVINEFGPHGYLSLICINDNSNEKFWYVADTTASLRIGSFCDAVLPYEEG